MRIIITRDYSSKIKVSLYILPKLSIKLNLDSFLKKYNCLSKSKKIEYIKKQLTNLRNNNKILIDIAKICRIRKIIIKAHYNYIKYPSTFIYFTLWNCLSLVKNVIDKYVYKVDKEEYQVVISSNNDVYIYLDIVFPLILLIFISIKNIKFITKEIIKYGSSNKRTIKTIGRKYNECN